MGFIENAAQQMWNQYHEDVSDHLFLFPSRRSMLYFKRAITETAGQNLWMPECITLEQWILDQSDFILVDPITSAYELYLSARQVNFTNDSFELFYPLAQIILSDFEQVDLGLVDPDKIWEHASAWQHLSEQEEPSSVWQEMKDTALKERWIVNWNKLNSLYKHFTQSLADQNLSTKGNAYRNVVHKIAGSKDIHFPHIHIIGFSSLTNAEVQILEYFRSKYSVHFYWNVSSVLAAPGLDAGNKVLKWTDYFGQSLSPSADESRIPETRVISTSGMVPQIKAISQLLGEAKGKEEKIAVLLPHPSLIDLFLSSFPDNLDKVNVSLGYPLIYSPVRSLLDWILSLWDNMEENGGKMNRPDLDLIWSHIYISNYMNAHKITIPDSRQLYFMYEDLKNSHEGLSDIYAPLKTPDEALDRLIILFDTLIAYQPEVFHREILRYMKGRLVRLNDVLSPVTEFSLIFLKRILFEMMQGASVPFRGEPMEGVQVLGIQEIQNLTFDTLIIPGMNEEILPSGKIKSMIPFSLRKQYGLDDMADIHATQSYYLWSAMLQAKNVHLLHSQGDDLLGAKGMSRYLYQLKYGGLNIPFQETFLDLSLTGFEPGVKKIYLNDEYKSKLHDYLKNKGLSPTALMSYIGCSFQFFLTYVLCIREDDTPSVGLDFRHMGTVIHDVMHEVYEPWQGKEISSDDFEEIERNIEAFTLSRYQKLYPHDDPQSLRNGIHWMEQEIIIRAVRRYITYDAGLKGLTITKLEASLKRKISTEHIEDVQLLGKIDRFDHVNDRYRIIDYKTGNSNLIDKNLPTLLEARNPAHNWQVLFYAFLLKDDLASAPFEMGHYTLKDKKLYVPMKTKRQTLHSVAELNEFENVLAEIIDEMIDPDVPFTQTEQTKICTYCVFNTFCERQGEI